MSSALPIRLRNDNLVTITEIENSISATNGIVTTDSELEQFICYNLSQNTLPSDISLNTSLSSTSLPGTSASISGNKETYDGIMISNNDDFIDSETMAIMYKYKVNPLSELDDIENFSLYTNFPQDIRIVSSKTTSYIDSHLKMEISFNNDLQNSIIDGSEDAGDWQMEIDRSINNGNYTSAVNSNLNTTNNSYPMNVRKIDSPQLYEDKKYISAIDQVTKKASYANFDSQYSFETNNLKAEINSTHHFESDDFTMYKFVQDVPTINQYVQDEPLVFDSITDTPPTISTSFLPVGDEFKNNLTTPTLVDFENNVISYVDENKIEDGFKIKVVIGDDVSGGFVLTDPSSNDVLSIDTSNILDSYSFIEAGLTNGSSTQMYIDISNGSVTLEGTDPSNNPMAALNVDSVDLDNDTEYLEYPYNTQDGLIEIRVQPVTNRVDIIDSSANYWNDVKVIYNCDECQANNVDTRIDVSMTLVYHGEYAAGIVVPTTTGDSYLNSDNSFNLLKSNDSALVVSRDGYDAEDISIPNIQDMSFNSNINSLYPASTIVFVEVENQNVLSKESPLVDASGATVPFSNATVTIKNIDLSISPYSDFKVKFETKTIAELSASTMPENNWIIESTNGDDILHTKSTQTSILHDDCLFMRSGLNTKFDYTFNIFSTTVTNAQAIKHKIDISFSDIILNELGNPILYEKHVYLDDNDITYSDISYTELQSSSFINYTINSNPYDLVKDNLIVEKVKTKVMFNASFETKLPFYTNIQLTSPTLNEYVDKYRLIDKNSGRPLPDIYLKYLKDLSGNPLSLVNVSQSPTGQSNGDYKTSLKVTPSNCSTLKLIVKGKDSTGTFVDISDNLHRHHDPYFNTVTDYYDINGNGKISVVAQVTYPTELSSPYYLIESSNAPGENISFITRLYTYDTTNKHITNDSFNNFDPYDSEWVTKPSTVQLTELVQQNLPIAKTLKNEVIRDSNDNFIMTIYAENGTHVLATVSQKYFIISDFNIIYCVNPLVRVIKRVKDRFGDKIVDDFYNYSVSVLKGPNNDKREIFIDDGIYAYTTLNPPRMSFTNFKLKSDEVRVEFVENSTYQAAGYNNGWDTFVHLTDISGGDDYQVYQDEGYQRIALFSGSDVSNSTLPVSFKKYRGYKRVGTEGVDRINIVRESITATFVLEGTYGTYTQTFPNFATDGVYTIDNAVKVGDPNVSFNIGLKINGNVSLAPESDEHYITFTGANIKWTFSNPINDAEVYSDGSGNLTDIYFPELFDWKSRNIYSPYYQIDIVYNIPKIRVFNLDVSGKDVNGNPELKNEWTNETPHYLTTTVIENLVDGLDINRTRSYVNKSFVSYAVILPRQLEVNYNDSITKNSFPFNPVADAVHKLYYLTVVDKDETVYSINEKFNLINSNIPELQDFSSLNNENIVILGNYLKIDYYYDRYDQTEPEPLVIENVFDNTIDKLELNNINSLDVTVNSVLYDVKYKQFVGNNSQTNINSIYNINFTISDAFISNIPPTIYFDLMTKASTVVTFYQSNIRLVDNSYVLIIDKFECPGVNYNLIIANIEESESRLNELFFIASHHYTFSIAVDGTDLPIRIDMLNMNDLFKDIEQSDIIFIRDNSFITSNIGVTLSALSTQGSVNLEDLVEFKFDSFLISKVSYINMPDIINVSSLFGSSVFRVTNSGNVRTPSVFSYQYNVMKSTELYSVAGKFMNNHNLSNNGYKNTETIISTLPICP
jgi:hypothetical protein